MIAKPVVITATSVPITNALHVLTPPCSSMAKIADLIADLECSAMSSLTNVLHAQTDVLIVTRWRTVVHVTLVSKRITWTSVNLVMTCVLIAWMVNARNVSTDTLLMKITNVSRTVELVGLVMQKRILRFAKSVQVSVLSVTDWMIVQVANQDLN